MDILSSPKNIAESIHKNVSKKSSAKNIGESIHKNGSKNLKAVDATTNLLIMLNKLQQMHLKMLQIEQFRKQQK